MLSELCLMLYFSFYLRNQLLYHHTRHDFVIFALVMLTAFGNIRVRIRPNTLNYTDGIVLYYSTFIGDVSVFPSEQA